MSRNTDPLQSAFSELEESAQRLNAASDRTNKLLSAAQQRLIATNVGLELWLHDEPIEEDERAGGAGQWATTHGRRTVLGFAKVEGSWMLAVREQAFERGFYEGDNSSPYLDLSFSSEASPLLKAPRQQRIAALVRLPRLIQELKRVADKAYQTILAHELEESPAAAPGQEKSRSSLAPRLRREAR